tara:strand:+ start:198 stop:371 length:174 start_codon:yes stop_codon:yes gene_type:complete
MEKEFTADDVAKCVIDTNGEYAECVDRLVASMGTTKTGVDLEDVKDDWYDEEGNLIP